MNRKEMTTKVEMKVDRRCENNRDNPGHGWRGHSRFHFMSKGCVMNRWSVHGHFMGS